MGKEEEGGWKDGINRLAQREGCRRGGGCIVVLITYCLVSSSHLMTIMHISHFIRHLPES